jgi:hypothetical protein
MYTLIPKSILLLLLNFIGFKIKLVYTEHSSSEKELKVVFKRIDPFFTGNTTGYCYLRKCC